MLKESTIKRYDVKQLTKHLLKHTGKFTWCPYGNLYILRPAKEGDIKAWFFYCSVHEYNRDVIIELIKEYTWN